MDKRKLGAYYTPYALSQILTDWALRSPQDTFLEPSFGGCGFIEAAKHRFEQLNCHKPSDQIFGCDIDPLAFEYLSESFSAPVNLDRFIQGDFLDINIAKQWNRKFSTIVGNPPYVTFQEIDDDTRLELSNRQWPVPDIGGRASLWAYFIAHSISFLENGGRMAWVLPGAFMQADYARGLRNFLSSSFSRIASIVIEDRLFLNEGAEEESVILLCENFNEKPETQNVQLFHTKSTLSLEKLISDWDRGKVKGVRGWHSTAHIGLSKETLQTLASLRNTIDVRAFGDFAKVQIGLVTGDNKFFVLSEKELEYHNLESSDCKRILTKFSGVKGLKFEEVDHRDYIMRGFKGFLIDSRDNLSNPRLMKYLDSYNKTERTTKSTFKKRTVWSQPDDLKIPDAFLTVMNQNGPRIALNPDTLTCTNTLHRVYFNNSMATKFKKLLAITLLTSFSQLSAELVGRKYGSGVLKHEPRDAEKIQILMPDISHQTINSYFNKIDKYLRNGELQLASQLADKLLYPKSGFDNWQDISNIFNIEINKVRNKRKR